MNDSQKSSLSGRQSKTDNSTYLHSHDLEHQFSVPQSEMEYSSWWSRERFFDWYYSLPEDTLWNCYICVIALMAIVWVSVNLDTTHLDLLDIVYNITYIIHVGSIAYNMFGRTDEPLINFRIWLGFLLDLLTYTHYASAQLDYKLVCYYLRLHRPFRYLWALNDYNLKGSVLGTTLKYCYICVVLRVTWALIWLNIDVMEQDHIHEGYRRVLYQLHHAKIRDEAFMHSPAGQFLAALYIVNKMFIPIGPTVAPANDIERIACLLVMLSGCLVVTGAAVASLSLVISLYMRPEETFRARYRLIIREMKDSHIPLSQRDKVETFYKMYWHKQRAVSCTQLLPTFPPTLPAIIYTDIYFEATQKTRILRDLSYQFLCELAKKMETIHYIPGDAIIKRSSKKSSIIYITYGDVEMLTAEDDSTAFLRMTRGTVLTPCAGCAAAGCGRAHLEIRAATFCTAHVLNAADLWRVAIKHGKSNEQAAIILRAFNEHLDRVKRHYSQKIPQEVKYKSSIFHFKRALLALKEARDSRGNFLLERTDVFLEIAGCYIMRNRASASLTDEADAICLRSTFPCILQPVSSLQLAWHCFVACLIVTVCMTHPYYMVFMKKVPIEFRFFDFVVTVVYALDLIVHLSTGANVEEGVPITFSQTSSQQMRSHWFVLDVVGTVPIFEFVGEGHFAGMNKLLRLPKVFRVLKGLEDRCVYRSNVLRFLSYTLLLLIACYLIASLQQAFMCFRFGYCQVTNFTHSPYWEYKPLDDEQVQERISFALYWAVSMITFTTHMQTWGPENWNNVLYTMFVLEICIVLRIFMEAVYSATIMVTTALREDYDASIAMVKNFLIRNQIDPVLRQRYLTYLQLCWFTDKAYSMTNKKSSIFYDLPPHVYQDIVAGQRSKYILCIPFMKFVHKEDLKNISSKARLFYTSPNEILLNTGDITNEMYVIKQGMCEIIHPDSKQVVGTIGVKNHFAVLICLLRLPAYYTVRTVTHVQVFSISRKHLLKVIELPKIKDALDYARIQPEYHRLLKHREPFLSYTPPEPSPNMERFRLPRKHEMDYAFLHPFNRLGFLSILRYIFPRFTIRPDGTYLTRYECFRAACAMASAMVFPSYCYMVLQWHWLYFMALLLDMAAYFDILQRMLVGYFNDLGILVYHPSSTAAHYVKGAFIVDLFGCLALENLDTPRKESFGPLGNMYRVTEIKQILMLNRLLQLYRLPSAMAVLDNYIERKDVTMVIRAVPLFLVLLNLLTCFLVFSSVNIFYSEEGDDWYIVPHNDIGGSWLYLFHKTFRFNLTATPWNLHLGCYFWVVYETTTTGYNCFNPSNFEVMQVIFYGMVIGTMIITYFSVRIISLRANVNKALAAFQAHMKDIVVFMKRERLDKDLQKDVLNYYEYNWDKMGGIDYRNVLKLCDQITLRTDAILHIFGPTFAKCPILAHCDVSLLRIIGRAVRSLYFLRGMRIIEANDVIQDMFFLDYGGVDVRETKGNMSTIVKLPRGSVFGNIEGATTIRCCVTFVATTRVHLLMINSQAFHQILTDFPAVQQLMMKFRRKDAQNYIIGNVGDSLKPWKERSLSSPTILRSRKGLLRHLFFRDKALQHYLIVVSLLCVYADVYNAGFQDNRMGLILALYALDLGFYLKILVQYMLPQIVDVVQVKNVLIPLRNEYFKGEFKYDVLSCIPIELFSLFSTNNRWLWFSWLRLNRMFRIITLRNCLKKRHDRITSNLIFSTIFAVLIWFTVFIHSISCLWFFIGQTEELTHPKSSWLYSVNGTLECTNMYICSVYFILTTFTQNGVGDIIPRKQSEVVFVCILQIVSTMVYMIYVGEFSNIIQYQSFRSFSFYCMYLELQEYLKNNRVSKNLVKLVNSYSLHLWRETRGMQEPYFLKSAPQCLRLRIMSAAYLRHLTKHNIFGECEPAFLRQLVGCLQLYTYNENMVVVKESEITDSMYFIHTGRVQETSESGGAHRIYTPDSFFGVEQGLVRDTPYKNSYMTLTKAQVLTLHLDDWVYLLQHFPACKAIILKHMDGADTDSSRGPRDKKYKGSPKPPRDRPRVIEQVDKGTSPTSSKDKLPFSVPPGPVQTDSKRISVPPGMWPMDSRNPRDSEEPTNEEIEESSSYIPSQRSKTGLTEEMQAKYGEEEPSSSSAFMNKVTSTAKKLMRKQSVPYLPSNESSEKDVLLLQEDEDATMALIQQFGQDDKTEQKVIPERVIATVSDMYLGDEEEAEEMLVALDLTQPQIKTDDTQQTDKQTTKHGDKEKESRMEPLFMADDEPSVDKQDNATSTSRLSRRHIRVRYEDDDKNTNWAEQPRTTRFVSDDLGDLKPLKDLSATERNLRTFDSDMTLVKKDDMEDEDDGTEQGEKSPSEDDAASSSTKRPKSEK